MDALYTVAFPVLQPEDAGWLEAVRAQHDAQGHALLRAHFTLVFGCSGLDAPTYVAHVISVAAAHARLNFVCRKAVVLAESAVHYVALVAQEGQSDVIDLHDALYSGLLQPWLRRDIPYVPHITLAKTGDPDVARELCASLNARPVCVQGGLTNWLWGPCVAARSSRLPACPWGSKAPRAG